MPGKALCVVLRDNADLQCPHGGQSPCRLPVGTPVRAPYGLAVPSWRAVSVPAATNSDCSASSPVLQCPHGGQSPCRPLARMTTYGTSNLQCPHGGQSPCRGASAVAHVHRLELAVPSWRAVSVPATSREKGRWPATPCSALMAGSLRAGFHTQRPATRPPILQCPHGGQSPCRAGDGVDVGVAYRLLQCPHGGQSPCRLPQRPKARLTLALAVPSWRAVSVPVYDASMARRLPRPCSALMAGSLRAGVRGDESGRHR